MLLSPQHHEMAELAPVAVIIAIIPDVFECVRLRG